MFWGKCNDRKNQLTVLVDGLNVVGGIQSV